MQVQLWEDGASKVFCRITMPLRVGGEVSLLATVDSRAYLQEMHRRGIQFVRKENGTTAARINGVDHEIGSLFGNIGKAMKKVAKVSALKKALALGKALVNSPIGRLVAPQAALAIKAAEGAAKLVAASKSKNPDRAKKAKIALLAATAQAQRENAAGKQLPLPAGVAKRSPESRGAFRYLVTVARTAA
jgi:hypothetical protein